MNSTNRGTRTLASERIAVLENEVKELEESEGDLDKAQSVVTRHHRALHEYNESKDSCQVSQ
ncbi:hypothetical protein BS47DRAFT_1345508 [Hydnum rufescens UP504]|uniref:Uncharacterized protein n=1 Tax=Hydnum rufescens UP504 TaxID=1448309 RepID=A0A9P6AUU6_9AGAM|nr:hypothetical protein BS47DRAFT_1345508 [Hydnum rufescens UP504]